MDYNSLREVSKYGVFSGPYFPAFELNTGIHNFIFRHFSSSDSLWFQRVKKEACEIKWVNNRLLPLNSRPNGTKVLVNNGKHIFHFPEFSKRTTLSVTSKAIFSDSSSKDSNFKKAGHLTTVLITVFTA